MFARHSLIIQHLYCIDKKGDDPDDDKFIACALSASADYIVSGDKELCDVGRYKSVRIIRASQLLKMID